ncbi:acylphosphatase [Echinimonas agarilytica]|uniref:acylphosphatase n=1 Tax=Echinimonas agarilytica TaxID=1215918 RepID=A0AA42B8J7_9GAMM|nr:acylphosphatase [Echinimonas agarilytica]MCM2680648.1 acylphosphatase [Echinimonas agarilytica]
MSIVAVKTYVSGRVQAVGFRFHTMEKAGQLNVCGFAQNLPDGRVYVYAEGHKNQLQNLVDWLEEGPETSEISSLSVEWLAAPEGQYQDFQIR